MIGSYPGRPNVITRVLKDAKGRHRRCEWYDVRAQPVVAETEDGGKRT